MLRIVVAMVVVCIVATPGPNLARSVPETLELGPAEKLEILYLVRLEELWTGNRLNRLPAQSCSNLRTDSRFCHGIVTSIPTYIPQAWGLERSISKYRTQSAGG